jgi:hypothetical protein
MVSFKNILQFLEVFHKTLQKLVPTASLKDSVSSVYPSMVNLSIFQKIAENEDHFTLCHRLSHLLLSYKLFSLKCLAELPMRRCNVIRCDGSPISGSNFKGEWLVLQVSITLPDLTPISAHRDPASPRSLYFHSCNFTIRADIGNQHLVEIGAPRQGESHATFSLAFHPAFILMIACSCKNSNGAFNCYKIAKMEKEIH